MKIESHLNFIRGKIPGIRESDSTNPEFVFDKYERDALLRDGAIIYTTRGKNIYALPNSRKIADHRSWPALETKMSKPVKAIQAAIYPNPHAFFVPGTLGQDMHEVRNRLRRDTVRLRERTSLNNVKFEVPGIAELADVLIQHEEATGVRLLHKDFGFPAYEEIVNGKKVTTQVATRCEGDTAYIAAYENNKGWGFEVTDPIVYRTEGRTVSLPDVALVRWVVPGRRSGS